MDRPSRCRSRNCASSKVWWFEDGTEWCFGHRKAKTRRCDVIAVCFLPKARGKGKAERMILTRSEACMVASGLTEVVADITPSPGGKHCEGCSDRSRCSVPNSGGANDA